MLNELLHYSQGFFFLQAEEGIRDYKVTGVQTCALPICRTIATTMIDLLLPYIVPGIIYGIGAIGIAIILRYLQAPDFTCLGAIMVGGIIAVIATNAIGPWCGILLGTLAGGMLGGITALLRCVLKIPLVLSGIITYTASISFGYLLTNRGGTGGTIALSKPT